MSNRLNTGPIEPWCSNKGLDIVDSKKYKRTFKLKLTIKLPKNERNKKLHSIFFYILLFFINLMKENKGINYSAQNFSVFFSKLRLKRL